MTSFSSLLTEHHRTCDVAFADAEAAASDEKWDVAREAMSRFVRLFDVHLRVEEETLFPAFEAASGMQGGPPAVMRMEHQQMRQLLGSLTGALEKKSKTTFLSAAETLLVLMQQHNMKEENILYPMCDRAVSASGTVEAVQSQLASVP